MLLHLPTQKVVQLDASCINFILGRKESFYLTNEGRIVNSFRDVISDHVVLHCRLHGGKGAFGSLLRFIGSQIEKTTNREAMRDLSGRRLHDVNNEQKLQQWAQKQTERQQQKDQDKEEKMKRLKEGPSHKFEDQKYFDQNSAIRDNLEDALNSALSSDNVMQNLVQSSVSVVGKSKASQESSKSSSTSSGEKVKTKKSTKGAYMMGLPDDIDSDDLNSSDSDQEDETVKKRNTDDSESRTKSVATEKSAEMKSNESEETGNQETSISIPCETETHKDENVIICGSASKSPQVDDDVKTNRKRTSSSLATPAPGESLCNSKKPKNDTEEKP